MRKLVGFVAVCVGLAGFVACAYALVLGGVDGNTEGAIKYMIGGTALLVSATVLQTTQH